MMDFEKLKIKRTAVRGLFTKLTTKIEGTIQNNITADYSVENKVEDLYDLKNQLDEKLKELKELDKDIEAGIDSKELEKEIIGSDKYRESGITFKTKIERCLASLNKEPRTARENETSHTEASNTRIIRNENNVLKLPRLNISVFSGDCSDWLDFWNSFEVAIHNNESLSKIEKFAYLKTYLKDTALSAISGFALTSENYDSSIELLKQRFARSDLIISSHMNKLLLIEPVKTLCNIKALRKMYDAIEIQVRSLKSLGVVAGTYSNLLCPVILQKIPDEINLQYNRQRKAENQFDINDLMEFLRNEIHCRETSLLLSSQRNSGLENSKHKLTPSNYNNNFNKAKSFPQRKITSTTSAFLTTTGNKCVFCFENSHLNENCPLNVSERKKSLINQGRCFACFGRRHVVKNCLKKNNLCKICKSPHNFLICESHLSKSSSPENKQNIAESSLLCRENRYEMNSHPVYLQTFCAIPETRLNKRILIRCLIDGGSTRTFVKKEIADSLKLKVITQEELIIYPFGNKRSEKQNYDIVELVLKSRINLNKKIKINAVVIDSITLGNIEIPSPWVRNVAFERGIELADVGITNEVHVLIGSDYLCDILGQENIRLSKRLVATNSIFGYVIQGRERESYSKEVHVSHLTVVNDDFDYERVKDLWELESIGINAQNEVSRSDEEILKEFSLNTTYENNRYETRLLWKNEFEVLHNNYEIAKKRLFNLNNKFKRNQDFYLNYKDIINEQLRENIIEPVDFSDQSNLVGYFMPHHGVVRESKETTKLRICYDASSKAKGEISLNDCLESGPNLNPDLLKIILKFRYHQIAFCADIQRAFLEVGIAKEDRKFLQFLWGQEQGTELDLGNNDVRVFQFTRTPFGVKCSPFILAATIKLHLKKYEALYPETCTILNQLYVDDLISGSDTVEQASFISKEAIEILKSASMNLRKWETNSPALKEIWSKNHVDHKGSFEESGVSLKILGLVWDNKNDTLNIATDQFQNFKCVVPTKRTVLRACGMLFDPLGIIAPFTIRIKLLMQHLWEIGVAWDEPLPNDVNSTFSNWLKEIINIQEIKIPRKYFDDSNLENLELHIFSDASPKAYGAVAYLRLIYPDKIRSSFVIAKSRIAPMKPISLPRLELTGALIAARLVVYLRSAFPFIKEDNIYMWSDSQICLYWIKGYEQNLKLYVKNRVTEIKSKTNPNNWYYCSGKENPADKLTRGMRSRSLMHDDVWFSGPDWLKNIDLKAKTVPLNSPSDEELKELEKEKKAVKVLFQTSKEIITPLFDLEKFSDLNKIFRITAYVIRFTRICRHKFIENSGPISAEELADAEMYWVHFIQKSEFSTEYFKLSKNLTLDPDSKLYGLNPILSSDGLICLGGRLQNSNFQYLEKHPMIIPGKSKFTELLIMREHVRLYHAGVSDTLTQIREKYWILRGRQSVKTCLNKCLVCRRYRAKQGRQIEAPLPADRLHAESAFEVVGIDFAGPLYTKDIDKAYVALFTCAVTRAIHLEVVSSLSTEHFLLAFRRFVSRRGICKIIYSDNALTFKTADKELKNLYMNIIDPTVQNYFGTKGISWKYIVERAAWWGGYWERMVRVTKNALRKVLGKALVSFEELQTVLIEIESIINSRPLTYVYNEPSEPFPLTPANFLTGKRLTSLPPRASHNNQLIVSSKKSLLKRYLYRERLLNVFWRRWKTEYLLQLKNAHYSKPMNNVTEFNVNDLVLIGDDRVPRQMWKMGKIIELHKGRDGKLRSVSIKTASGILKRPIQLVYAMELDSC